MCISDKGRDRDDFSTFLRSLNFIALRHNYCPRDESLRGQPNRYSTRSTGPRLQRRQLSWLNTQHQEASVYRDAIAILLQTGIDGLYDDAMDTYHAINAQRRAERTGKSTPLWFVAFYGA